MRPERARFIALLLSWTVWLGTVAFLVAGNPPKLAVALLMLSGYVPYLVSIHLVEPWLEKRGPGSEPRTPDD